MTDKKDKILVVDDNPDIRIVMQHRLSQEGFLVDSLGDPGGVLERIAEGDIDLILLDIMMPKMDGFEVLRRLRVLYGREDVPVVMLTASSAQTDVARALSLGANDYATKGEQWETLLRRIRVHLNLKKSRNKFVGPYRIERKIGAGSMGVVFAAVEPTTNEQVAVKVLPRSAAINEMYVKRFLLEAELASRVNHPSIVRVLQAGRFEETYYLAMELIIGENLVERFGGLPMEPRLSLTVCRDVALALQALHKAGVTHRDVKPENIVLSEQGRVVLTDLGVALDDTASTRITSTGYGVGTPVFAAPEQLDGRADPRSDMYGLGATLYWMLTGEAPFSGDNPREIFHAKLANAPDPRGRNGGIAAPVALFVKRLLQPRPDQRFKDDEALLAALGDLMAAADLT